MSYKMMKRLIKTQNHITHKGKIPECNQKNTFIIRLSLFILILYFTKYIPTTRFCSFSNMIYKMMKRLIKTQNHIAHKGKIPECNQKNTFIIRLSLFILILYFTKYIPTTRFCSFSNMIYKMMKRLIKTQNHIAHKG